MKKVTVILSSYNGEKYIEEQLYSLLNQEREIDEVIISDDCSTDGTPKIIANFIYKNGLNKKWFFYQNVENMGWKKNFFELLRLASGDYIFLCDQDDIWLPHKIKSMVEIMEKNNNIEVLASNYISKYENGAKKISHKITKKMNNTNDVKKVIFNKHFMEVLRPGCTFVVRQSLIKELDYFSDNEFAHDAILWRISLIKDSLYIFENKTIIFRRHDNNASKENKNLQNYLKIYLNRKDFCRQLISYIKINIENAEISKKLNVINKKLNFYTNIIDIFQKRSLFRFILMYGKNYSYYYTQKSAALDFLLIAKAKRSKKI
ncbi:glycosyltransferase [Enterococcus sp. HMSC069A01]|uniref:glycosyltransferase n=1 Tax=Enterococcus sp. HMSC069A01 TaxID=1715125 RepID=UPI0008A64C5C|nr:glycosyltransferase [Enterococcus sp. HMSC069A01]OFM89560.1 glycosyltransferase [Enterococcus sp. HMSC069A01]